MDKHNYIKLSPTNCVELVKCLSNETRPGARQGIILSSIDLAVAHLE